MNLDPKFFSRIHGPTTVKLNATTCDEVRNAIESLQSGGTVFLDTERVIVRRPITLRRGITLVGRGSRLTTIELAPGAACHVLTNQNHDGGDSNIGLAGFTVQGNMESQERPADSKSLTFCCAIYLKRVTEAWIDDVSTINIRQTGAHFSQCEGIRVSNFTARRLGWSGISTSGTSDIQVEAFIFDSGLDVVHSGVHFDGGTGVYFKGLVHESRGNGIMLDSAFSELSGCSVNASVSACYRGLSLSGSHRHLLHRVSVTGSYFGNRECGIMVSNANTVTISEAKIVSNGKHGILFQGKNGGSKCLTSNCQILDHENNISQHHSSSNNIFVAIEDNDHIRLSRPLESYSIDQSSISATIPQARQIEDMNISSVAHLAPEAAYPGRCCVCGQSVVFAKGSQGAREGYRCPVCKASTRYRVQAQALLRAIDLDHESISIASLPDQPTLRSKTVYEPGIIGPFRKYIEKSVSRYEKSYFWSDIKLGELKNGIRNENLESLTFEDESFDLVITSDIFEHIRKPLRAFCEVSRILRPGGAHVFTVPATLPLRQKTIYRVDTTGEQDVMTLEPAFHIAGDGGKSLVYTEFGEDLFTELQKLTGDRIEVVEFCAESDEAPQEVKRMVAFIQWRHD